MRLLLMGGFAVLAVGGFLLAGPMPVLGLAVLTLLGVVVWETRATRPARASDLGRCEQCQRAHQTPGRSGTGRRRYVRLDRLADCPSGESRPADPSAVTAPSERFWRAG